MPAVPITSSPASASWRSRRPPGATATRARASACSRSRAARATCSRAHRRRRRGAPPDRHRRRRRAALPVGRGRRPRRAARAHRGARAARRRRQPEPLPGPRLQARLDHAPRRRESARRPTRTCSSASRSPTALGSTAQSLWLADGTNYPGQDDLRARRGRMLDCLGEVYAALPAEQELLVEYKFFEPAFYATDLADWGSALLACQAARRARAVLVDLGHHAQGTNVEQIVALLADEDRLGGFHFNNRKYADDDLIVGSVNPFELFLIFCELAAAPGPLPRLTIDQSHNVEAEGRGDGAERRQPPGGLREGAARRPRRAARRAGRRATCSAATSCCSTPTSTDVRAAVRARRGRRAARADDPSPRCARPATPSASPPSAIAAGGRPDEHPDAADRRRAGPLAGGRRRRPATRSTSSCSPRTCSARTAPSRTSAAATRPPRARAPTTPAARSR